MGKFLEGKLLGIIFLLVLALTAFWPPGNVQAKPRGDGLEIVAIVDGMNSADVAIRSNTVDKGPLYDVSGLYLTGTEALSLPIIHGRQIDGRAINPWIVFSGDSDSGNEIRADEYQGNLALMIDVGGETLEPVDNYFVGTPFMG